MPKYCVPRTLPPFFVFYYLRRGCLSSYLYSLEGMTEPNGMLRGYRM